MVTETLDLLLGYLNENRKYHTIAEIHKSFKPLQDAPIIDVLIHLSELVKDGYAIEEIQKDKSLTSQLISETEIYHISVKGIHLTETGGYAVKYAEEQRLRVLNERQIKSSIRTNRSVLNTNRTIKITSVITLIIVIVALVISILQYKRDDEVKVKMNQDQYKELQQMQNTILQAQKDMQKNFLVKDTLKSK